MKDTIKLYILAENEKNLSGCFRENSKYLMFDYFSLILRKLHFFETFCLSYLQSHIVP